VTPRKRVAVLISGRGSNMSALIAAAKDTDYPAEIVGVLSNKADAPGLAIAAGEGIPIAVRTLRDYADKLSADRAITEALETWNTDIVALAGFMRLLSPEFVTHWAGRLINIHPSLLPAFKGLDTHQRAIEAGSPEHGCTVHFVTAEMDEGPVIAQERVEIRSDDTADTLAARVLAAEHGLYPRALAMVARGDTVFSHLTA
jgi:phosphoribosylglycinamide formyltransferase 1